MITLDTHPHTPTHTHTHTHTDPPPPEDSQPVIRLAYRLGPDIGKLIRHADTLGFVEVLNVIYTYVIYASFPIILFVFNNVLVIILIC